MTTIEVPVLIIGAGPVGLGLALDLGGRGIECLVIDQMADLTAGIKINPRAAAVTPRTMEFCRRWGVADAVRNSGFPEDFPFNLVYCTALDGYTLALHQFPSMKSRVPHPVSPETRQRCPQIWFDPILIRGLAQFPTSRLRTHWELESFADTGEGVRAAVRDLDTGEMHTVVCRYMVACDGSGSKVRDDLGVTSDGAGNLSYALNIVIDIPGFLGLHDKGPAERYYFIDGRGIWAILTVIDGRDRWRFGLMGSMDPKEVEGADFRAAIAEALGDHVKFDIVALAPWRRRETIARRFRVGNVFLAGDAAHSMAPNLGLGMNTGASDAFDLGWKLEAALKGWAGPGLLDSYEFERRPASIRNAEASTATFRRLVHTDENSRHVKDPGPNGERARARFGEQLLQSLPDGWDTLGLAMGYRYEGSPICVADGTPPPEERGYGHYVQSSRPGGRAPHAWLPDGRSTIDLFGRGFTLLRFADADVSGITAAAAGRGVPLAVVDIADPAIAALYERRLVLVRPDGHVAWRADAPPEAPTALVDRIRGA
ncbi:MAG: FAD-dependent monooxygenase [Alphaproteobacteria bacterium]